MLYGLSFPLCTSDSSMVEFVQYQDTTVQYYTDLMRKLERMNGTLGFMLHYLDGMQSRIEGRLYMIQGYLGWAGTQRSASKQVVHVLEMTLFTIGKTWVYSSEGWHRLVDRSTLLPPVVLVIRPMPNMYFWMFFFFSPCNC